MGVMPLEWMGRLSSRHPRRTRQAATEDAQCASGASHVAPGTRKPGRIRHRV